MTSSLPRLLIVDDDEAILLTARIVLRRYFSVTDTLNDASHITSPTAGQPYDVVLLDMNFTPGNTSGNEGLTLLKQIKTWYPACRVVLMTAYGDIALAVKAMKAGAFDFVVKPWNNDDLIAIALSAARRSNVIHPRATPHQWPWAASVSPAMQAVNRLIEKVAPTDANILISGESGTGKNLVANAIHERSGRHGAPMVHVDLGAIAPTLFESELFGHEKGAFTDAGTRRAGPFEQVSGGTILLDEIGNVPLPLQSKLLTVLQSRKVTRVGSNLPVEVDFRLVCATNQNLRHLVETKGFRDDLFFRINTVTIELPPLRDRTDDIAPLANGFVEHFGLQYGKPNLRTGNAFLRSLMAYEWPGNIRELQHVIERAVIMTDTGVLTPADLHLPTSPPTGGQFDEGLSLESLEKEAIRQSLLRNGGNLTQAARELGLGRTTLYRKMEKYGL